MVFKDSSILQMDTNHPDQTAQVLASLPAESDQSAYPNSFIKAFAINS